MGLAVGVHGLPASAVVVVVVTAVEADQGAGILTVRVLLLFVGGLGKDRRVDEVVVVVGDTEEEPDLIPRSRQSGSDGYSAGSSRTNLIHGGLRTRKSEVAPRKKGCLGGGGNK